MEAWKQRRKMKRLEKEVELAEEQNQVLKISNLRLLERVKFQDALLATLGHEYEKDWLENGQI